MSWYLCALTDFKDAGRQANIATSLAVKIALKVNCFEEGSCLSIVNMFSSR